jgi:NAD+ synthetase
MPVLNVEKLIENRVNAIKDYHEEAGIKRAQLDVSGGVDSAVMLGLLAKAVGPDNITAVYSDIDSSDASEQRAIETAAKFGVNLAVLDLNVEFDNLVDGAVYEAQKLSSKGEEDYTKFISLKDSVRERMAADPTILGSFRSCIRAPIGRFMNRLMGNGIRHGTGNECEDRWLRFYQKGGDGEVDTNPLAMLSKGEVFQLAIGLGVPDSVLRATPSPDLQGVGEDGHNDEDELLALTGVAWTYSRILMEDMPERGLKRGDYTYIGTIERMSRLTEFMHNSLTTIQKMQNDWELEHYKAGRQKYFPGLSSIEIDEYVNSAIDIEAATRHKENPNCPTLGNRKELLELGILTNELPKV